MTAIMTANHRSAWAANIRSIMMSENGRDFNITPATSVLVSCHRDHHGKDADADGGCFPLGKRSCRPFLNHSIQAKRRRGTGQLRSVRFHPSTTPEVDTKRMQESDDTDINAESRRQPGHDPPSDQKQTRRIAPDIQETHLPEPKDAWQTTSSSDSSPNWFSPSELRTIQRECVEVIVRMDHSVLRPEDDTTAITHLGVEGRRYRLATRRHLWDVVVAVRDFQSAMGVPAPDLMAAMCRKFSAETVEMARLRAIAMYLDAATGRAQD
jgi:hypothetical protein